MLFLFPILKDLPASFFFFFCFVQIHLSIVSCRERERESERGREKFCLRTFLTSILLAF